MAEITSLNDFFIEHPMYHRSLAELMGVSTSIVDKWSNGDRRVSQRTLKELNRLHIFLNTNPQIRDKYVKVAQCAV
ncbi:helix-turn-helix transcriptional regulator [Nostoc sp. UHCC 0870]|uniref:helix-turn-helix transcriptional regulator n=1 Tax=Nostoc sp. UHCC 0870 TaxID=2914041 RepID=UPI001EE0C9E1|nr:helix-turn-helix transcriptional regulator [Nostoc sp. UHCC 0870]UKP01004.1 helix-turn-helix domain-containing protein [Nostoc sp. UHCC 0870]